MTIRRHASDIPPSRTGNYTGGEPTTRRRSFGRRFLLYATFSTLFFYGGSVALATRSDRYAGFFTESVPLGEKIMDFVDQYDLEDVSVTEAAGKAASIGKAVYSSLSGAASRTFSGDSSSTGGQGEKDVRTLLAEARDKAAREARKAKLEVQSASKDAQEKGQELYQSAKQRSEQLVEQAKQAAQRAEDEVRAKAQELVGGAKDAKAGALRETRGLAGGVKVFFGNQPNTEEGNPKPIGNLTGGKSSDQVAAPTKPWSEPLPLQHEPPAGYIAPRSDRPLSASNESKAALRPDPGAPQLPLLAPAISKLASSSSEPVIAQLASTIDDLAQFIKDAPATSSFQAKEVLNLARADLEKLTDRLDAIKEQEAARVDAALKQQQSKYEAELSRASERANQDLTKKDEEWHKNFEVESTKQVKEYQTKLQAELATQSELINERLREEVIAQGIELQRRWMRDIKARVEQERGGRLARLAELATQVKHLENVTRENGKEMESSSRLNTLMASIRALQTVINSPGLVQDGCASDDGGEDEAILLAGKQPFRDSLRRLKANASATDSPIISSVLSYLDQSPIPDEGVDSFITLSTWFQDKVSPAVLRTALLPENAGVLAHATSALLAPLLFKKRASASSGSAPVIGEKQQQDVPSILARAEYLLQREDLDGAAREVNQLQGWGKILAQDWLRAARNRLEVSQALEAVKSETRYLSLLNA
ncbi:hypothetical protein K437DRAFT_258737 [Tilletiaria anomala UBC 951]|uniref:MICOS complex subunit MIC60 n=1 Tax=Tilletiaria anomala (strain ATCC 24038 / CBS 436.72 / UBC 951) TaxID=1037660 RepID=A0A066VNI6_TILAU|nr:uncharacterized protein K437DRAFT_258737 [Tilletiaria anomala UBC 951]KDN40155.1 hypothetical protein K437DRAFT_258737 [Tilletiaria anomala UBC 951]